MSLRRPLFSLVVVVLVALAVGRASGDSSSGPDRVTIISQPWGTIYHLPFSVDTHMSQDMFGEFTITASNGAMSTVKQEGNSAGYVIFYPDEKTLTVRKAEDGELQIDLRGRKGWYRTTNDGWVLHLPTDEIQLRKKDNQVTLTGKQGKTVAVEGPNGFTVTSPNGETRYAREDFEHPFKFSGVPIQSHPYVVRGIWIEAQGLGAFIDFKLASYSRAFAVLGWHPMLMLEDH